MFKKNCYSGINETEKWLCETTGQALQKTTGTLVQHLLYAKCCTYITSNFNNTIEPPMYFIPI